MSICIYSNLRGNFPNDYLPTIRFWESFTTLKFLTILYQKRMNGRIKRPKRYLKICKESLVDGWTFWWGKSHWDAFAFIFVRCRRTILSKEDIEQSFGSTVASKCSVLVFSHLLHFSYFDCLYFHFISVFVFSHICCIFHILFLYFYLYSPICRIFHILMLSLYASCLGNCLPAERRELGGCH